MRDTRVDRARHGEQPVPRCGAFPEDRAEAVLLFQLLDEVADAVGGDVEVVVARQQAAFLGKQQEYDSHHHRDDAGVEVIVGDACEQCAVRLAVKLVEGGDQKLDGLADLPAELLGDLFLAFERLGEQGGKLVLACFGLEPGAGEQRDESLPRRRFLAEQGRVPDRRPGRAAARRPHERPPTPVGDDPDWDVAGAEQDRQPFDCVRRPAPGTGSGQRMSAPCGDHAEQLPRAAASGRNSGVAARFCVGLVLVVGLVVVLAVVLIRDVFVGVFGLLVEVAEVRADRHVVFGDDLGEGLRDGIADDEVLLPVEDIVQQSLDDLVPARAAVVHHLGDEPADLGPFRGPDFRQAVREHAVHDWEREERSGGLQQFKP